MRKVNNKETHLRETASREMMIIIDKYQYEGERERGRERERERKGDREREREREIEGGREKQTEKYRVHV